MNAITDPGISGNPIRGAELRADAKERHVALCRLIATLAQTRPVILEAHEWAGPLTQAQWAARAGLHLRTFKRLIAHPPIVVAARGVGARKVTYLRLGTVEPEGLRRVQNSMAKLWRRHIGPDQAAQRDYRHDYGLICGLAADLPRGWQIEIFDYALSNWALFTTLAKHEIEVAQGLQDAGVTVGAPDEDWGEDGFDAARLFAGQRLYKRYFNFPALSYLRKFHHVAVTLYREHLRDTGKEIPPALHPRQ